MALLMAVTAGGCVHTSSATERPSAALPPMGLSSLDVAVQKVMAAINNQDTEELYELYAGNMQNAFTPESTEELFEKLRVSQGSVVEVSAPKEPARGVYVFKTERGQWHAKVGVDDDGRISELVITDQPEVHPPVKTTTVPMRLPFRDEVFVLWGGADQADNAHVVSPVQRRATDLAIVDARGNTHAADGKRNDDYYVFGKEVLAAAGGIVVRAVDGIQDNVPGVTNRYLAVGNLVLVKQADAEYAVYAHLKNGSVRVKEGDTVRAGHVLGLCGNSGHSTEAHLHFHVQDGPFLEGSWGVEPVIGGVTTIRREKRHTFETSYTFLKGDRVRPTAEDSR